MWMVEAFSWVLTVPVGRLGQRLAATRRLVCIRQMLYFVTFLAYYTSVSCTINKWNEWTGWTLAMVCHHHGWLLLLLLWWCRHIKLSDRKTSLCVVCACVYSGQSVSGGLDVNGTAEHGTFHRADVSTHHAQRRCHQRQRDGHHGYVMVIVVTWWSSL